MKSFSVSPIISPVVCVGLFIISSLSLFSTLQAYGVPGTRFRRQIEGGHILWGARVYTLQYPGIYSGVPGYKFWGTRIYSLEYLGITLSSFGHNRVNTKVNTRVCLEYIPYQAHPCKSPNRPNQPRTQSAGVSCSRSGLKNAYQYTYTKYNA